MYVSSGSLSHSFSLLAVLGSHLWGEPEGEMYLCASLNVPHTNGVIIRTGDKLSTPGGTQSHRLGGTSVGVYQRAVAPATSIQEPNITLQWEEQV